MLGIRCKKCGRIACGLGRVAGLFKFIWLKNRGISHYIPTYACIGIFGKVAFPHIASLDCVCDPYLYEWLTDKQHVIEAHHCLIVPCMEPPGR